MDPILLREIERIIIIAGAVFFAYLGYRLYRIGVERGIEHITAESKFVKFVLSGAGPGLFFMGFGGILLTTALFTSNASQSKLAETVPIIQKDGTSQTMQILGKSSDKYEKSEQEQLEVNLEKLRKAQEQILNQQKSTDLSKEKKQNLLLELSKLDREIRIQRQKIKRRNKYRNM